jgi:outer membrane receptor protein involved in Fe transport
VSWLRPTFGVDYVNFDFDDSGFKLREVVFGVREDLELEVSPRVTLRAGLDVEAEQSAFEAEIPIPTNYRNPGAGRDQVLSVETQEVTIDQWSYGIGFYADSILEVTDRLQLIPGVRFELFRYFENDRLAVDPRLTARYALRSDTSLKAGAGLYSQAPQPPQVTEQFGNPHLTLEHAAHLSAGVEHQILPALSIDAQLYYLRRYNLPVATDAVRVEGGDIRPLRYVNKGNAYSYGLELILKHDVTRHFYGWLAYTLAQSKVQNEVDGDYVNAAFDQTHILTLVASYKPGRGWEIGTRFRLVSGRPETVVLGGVFDNDIFSYRRIVDDVRTGRRPLFHQLDLRVEKTWFFDRWRLSAYLDVQNVYNAENPEATLYDYRYAESAPLRGLPILPSVGIKGSF